MKKALTSLTGAVLLSACVQLPDILVTKPVKTASYNGSQADMVECVRRSVPGGKVHRSPDGSKIDVYDAKKAWDYIEVSHYAVSVYKNGTLELRKLPEGTLTAEANKRLWLPLERCIEDAATV